MLTLAASEFIRATGAAVVVAGTRDPHGEVVIDSRQVEKNGVFVAFVGERVDGNAHLAAAARDGAAVVIASREPDEEAVCAARECGCWLLRAKDDDCEEFLLRLAGFWREVHPNWLVVGVTGSVGKTTTKDMLRAAIASQRKTHATAGNFNNLIGLPLTLLRAPEDAEVVVCELGMNHAGEIARLTQCAHPTLAVITNVGTSHIGMLGSREGIARAKAEIVQGMRAWNEVAPRLTLTSACDKSAFIDEKFARPAGIATTYVGNRAEDSVRKTNLVLDEQGCASFDVVCSDGWSGRVQLPMPGTAPADDALLALAVVWQLGLDRSRALQALEHMPVTRMRLDVKTTRSGARIIDDSYNAAPASMAASLDVLASMSCTGRRIAVLGEIGELGDEAKRLHGYVGAYAAAKGLDLLVCVGGPLADELAESARTMGQSADACERMESAEETLRVIGPVLGAGDVVLVKGSRSVGLDAFVMGVLDL